jgi:sodium-dependent dicarboxylate transporter 2/3/5
MQESAVQKPSPSARAGAHSIERWQRTAAFVAGPLAGGLLYLIPLPGLPPTAHTLASILAWVVLYWIMEPIPLPVTALLGTAFCVLAGLGPAKTVFASYAHPVIFLFIGSFFLAEAMRVQGVHRRFAAWMLSLPWVGTSLSRILLAIGAVTAIISMWISNTAATALMLPVALGIFATLDGVPAAGLDRHMQRYKIGLLLMLSYAATAGGMATIIGTPPNLIGIGLIAQQTGATIPFLTWMAFGLPLAILMLLLSWALLHWSYQVQLPVMPNLERHLHEVRAALGPWTRGQINACLAFGTAVVLWIGPGLIAAAWGSDSPLSLWLDAHLPVELVAVLAAGLLFVLPVNLRAGVFTLTWKQATGIDWGTILLFGGGLAFGELMAKTGLSNWMGQGFVALLGVETLWGLTGISVLVAMLISQLTSNTATASMVVPIAIAIAQSAGVSAIPPALGACLGASFGFALPVSTPPNAIVYGTGLVPIRSMILTGLLFDLLGSILIWLTLRLLCPLLGLA